MKYLGGGVIASVCVFCAWRVWWLARLFGFVVRRWAAGGGVVLFGFVVGDAPLLRVCRLTSSWYCPPLFFRVSCVGYIRLSQRDDPIDRRQRARLRSTGATTLG